MCHPGAYALHKVFGVSLECQPCTTIGFFSRNLLFEKLNFFGVVWDSARPLVGNVFQQSGHAWTWASFSRKHNLKGVDMRDLARPSLENIFSRGGRTRSSTSSKFFYFYLFKTLVFNFILFLGTPEIVRFHLSGMGSNKVDARELHPPLENVSPKLWMRKILCVHP